MYRRQGDFGPEKLLGKQTNLIVQKVGVNFIQFQWHHDQTLDSFLKLL